MVGVDLSSRMIHQARERKVYDELFVEDLIGFLNARVNQFDLAIAADVLEYMGDLSGVLAAVSQALRVGGAIAFTVEKHDGPGYVLNPTRRYAHSIEYVRSLLGDARMREVSASESVLRTQDRRDVAGWVIVLQKSEI